MATASDKYAPGTIVEDATGEAIYVKLEDENGRQQWQATYITPSSTGGESYSTILHFDVAEARLRDGGRIIKHVRPVVPITPALPSGTMLTDATGSTVFIKAPDGGWERFYGGRQVQRFDPMPGDAKDQYPESSVGTVFRVVELGFPKDAA